MPVFVRENLRAVRSVQDVVIDPANGKVIAFAVGKGMVVTPGDVLSMKHGVLVDDFEDIIESEEVLRVGKVLKEYGVLSGKKVVGENGNAFGKISDFVVDDSVFALKKIYVSKNLLGMVHYDNRIFSAKDIVEILPDSVVVKDDARAKVATEEVKKGGEMLRVRT